MISGTWPEISQPINPTFLLVSASFALLKKEEVLIPFLFSWQGQFGVCENVVPKDEVSKLQKIIIILSNLIYDIFFCLAFFSSWLMQPSAMVATEVQTELNLPQWLTMNVSIEAIYYSFCCWQHDFFCNPLTVECGNII